MAYIMSVNIARRHMTKGQIAMAAARARSVSENRRRGTLRMGKGYSLGRIGQAATVIEFARDLADSILAGTTPLDTAYW